MPTWSVEATGYVGSEKLRSMNKPVKQLVRMFVNDYLAANPINETKTTLTTHVFSGPGGVFKILGNLTGGEKLNIREERNGWFRISTDAIPHGWVPKTFTEKAEGTDPVVPMKAPERVTKKGVQDSPIHEATLTQPTHVYSGPGTPFDLLGILPRGHKLDLFEERNGWYRIANGGMPYGWVHRSTLGMNPGL